MPRNTHVMSSKKSNETIAEMVVEKLLKSGALAEYLNEHLTETFLNGEEKMDMPRLLKELKQSVEAAKRSAEDAASAISALRRVVTRGLAGCCQQQQQQWRQERREAVRLRVDHTPPQAPQSQPHDLIQF